MSPIDPRLCGKCLKDRAHPTHDPDLEDHFDHEFVRVTVVDSHPDGSVLTQKSFWMFVGGTAAAVGALVLLRYLMG